MADDAVTSDNEDTNSSAADDQETTSHAEDLYPEDNQDQDTSNENDESTDDDESESDSDKEKDDEEGGDEEQLKFDLPDLPEGMEVDTALLDKFSAFAKENGLDQDKAQGLVDLFAEQQIDAFNAQQDSFENMVTQWREDSEKDPEIAGRDGSLLAENTDLANKAFETFFPGAKDIFDSTKLGDHPEIVRGMIKLGRAISEDSIRIDGGPGGEAPKSQANTLYPDMK